MKQSKYALPEFWKTKTKLEPLWHGLFENKPIERNSFIISPVILNPYSNQGESSWAVYPNIHSVIGFLQFIYLPTAFTGLFEESLDSNYYFADEYLGILEEYKTIYPEKIELINKAEKLYKDLLSLWNEDTDVCGEKLMKWTEAFHEDWIASEYISFSFNIFTSPKEVAHYLIDVYENDLDIGILEDDIGFTKEEFLRFSSDEIYDNEFMKRKFTDILLDRLTVTI